MQVFGFQIPEGVIGIVIVLLFFFARRIARRAGRATGAAIGTRPTPADSAPPAAAPAPPATSPTSTTFTTFTTFTTADPRFTTDTAGIADPAVSPGFAASAADATRGALGVAEVTSISTWNTDVPQVELELDAIGVPTRRVSAALPAGMTLESGDRVYVRIDPDDDSTVSILPASMTGGQTLPKGGNRLDALVLGPQILRLGAKATGVVKLAEPRTLANAALAERGMSKWYLELEVQPEQGWPYRAELTITLSTPEKAARIAHPGAEVLLRYDPEDSKTIAIDSIAMGYGDPYASLAGIVGTMHAAAPAMAANVAQAVANAMASTGGDYKVVMIDGGDRKIHAIKVLRDVRPDLSLKAAKDIIESHWETGVVEGLSQAQAQAICSVFEQAGARVEVRLA